MFDGKSRFTVNDSEVAAKVIDGEAILINLGTGVYYSLDKTGAVIWEYLAKSLSFDTTLNILLSRYDANEEVVRSDLERITAELCKEKLLVVKTDTIATDAINLETSFAAKEAYESPKLSVYNDMGDLLALDPPMPKLSNTPWTNG